MARNIKNRSMGIITAVVLTASTLAVAQQPGDQSSNMDRGMGPGAMGPCYGYYRGEEMGGNWGSGAMSPGMMGWNRDREMMGPGMMGWNRGREMMGPGMMDWNRGREMMGPGGRPSGDDQHQWSRSSALSSEDVKEIIEGQLAWQGNPNLKVGAIEEKDENTIVAEIVTREDSLVQRLEVDRTNGQMRPVSDP